MKKKIIVTMVLLLTATIMGAFGTGAIDVFSATRSADVSIVSDADGYVAITGDPVWTEISNIGVLSLNFSETNQNTIGNGFNRNSVTEVYNVFQITNQSPKDVYVWLEPGSGWVVSPWTHANGSGAREFIRYVINQSETDGTIIQSNHLGHSKFDMLGTFTDPYDNGEQVVSQYDYHSSYVKLTPGQKVSINVICKTAGTWFGSQSYFEGIIDHNIIVKANADAPTH